MANKVRLPTGNLFALKSLDHLVLDLPIDEAELKSTWQLVRQYKMKVVDAKTVDSEMQNFDRFCDIRDGYPYAVFRLFSEGGLFGAGSVEVIKIKDAVKSAYSINQRKPRYINADNIENEMVGILHCIASAKYLDLRGLRLLLDADIRFISEVIEAGGQIAKSMAKKIGHPRDYVATFVQIGETDRHTLEANAATYLGYKNLVPSFLYKIPIKDSSKFVEYLHLRVNNFKRFTKLDPEFQKATLYGVLQTMYRDQNINPIFMSACKAIDARSGKA